MSFFYHYNIHAEKLLFIISFFDKAAIMQSLTKYRNFIFSQLIIFIFHVSISGNIMLLLGIFTVI